MPKRGHENMEIKRTLELELWDDPGIVRNHTKTGNEDLDIILAQITHTLRKAAERTQGTVTVSNRGKRKRNAKWLPLQKQMDRVIKAQREITHLAKDK
jgi:hypothetical protein